MIRENIHLTLYFACGCVFDLSVNDALGNEQNHKRHCLKKLFKRLDGLSPSEKVKGMIYTTE